MLRRSPWLESVEGREGFNSDGCIERFSMQGDVRMAWVRWADSLALPNPEPVPEDTLERVTE
jgi:hypothetical protein